MFKIGKIYFFFFFFEKKDGALSIIVAVKISLKVHQQCLVVHLSSKLVKKEKKVLLVLQANELRYYSAFVHVNNLTLKNKWINIVYP